MRKLFGGFTSVAQALLQPTFVQALAGECAGGVLLDQSREGPLRELFVSLACAV